VTIEDLREKLRKELTSPYDPEVAHGNCERLLLEFIGDAVVTALWDSAEFWYA